MALTKTTASTSNIQDLSDTPNATEGLTADQLKKKFDDYGIDNKTYINEVLTVELDNEITKITSNTTAINSGWNVIGATLTYSSADAPTFVATTSIDLTGIISVGMKLKLTQTTVKYFIVTAITTNSITLYGGTDYTLANATITLPYYSSQKAPYGFPMDRSKWTVTVIDTTDRSKINANAGTIYYSDFGSVNITVPAGMFDIKIEGILGANIATGTPGTYYIPNSYSALSESSSAKTNPICISRTKIGGYASATSGVFIENTFERTATVVLTAKKTYYYIFYSDSTGYNITSPNSLSYLVITAVCKYL